MGRALEVNMKEEKSAYIKKGCFSIHTFEVKIPLNKMDSDKYRMLLETSCTMKKDRSGYRNRHYYACARTYPGMRYANCFTCYDNEEQFRRGISDICLVEKMLIGDTYGYGTVAASIRFRVNPRMLLGYTENKYICIVPNDGLSSIMPMLVRTLEPYGFEKEVLKSAVIRRLDFCVNISLGDQGLAGQYMELLRKGGTYRGLSVRDKPYDTVSHRRKQPQNEVRYLGTREELSIYLKYAQMQDAKGNHGYPVDEIERAKGQVRFELRIRCNKVAYLKEQYGCNDLEEFIAMAGIVGTDIFVKYLHGLYGSGVFLKTSSAVALIEQECRHRRAITDTMIKIVRQTRKSDMADAFRELTEGKKFPYRKYQFMKYFDELGISPITFPDSWKVEKFGNPLTYILEENVNEH